ncbi:MULTISPECIES: bacteriophage abortive infection AbiH family protein [Pseudomonas syringae group]|uniref:Bacteriophage abortive infection AbiH family protein n=2 Tax=Pseudomonas syringae group TaxID=136849 RepID=A0AAW4DWV5_PSESX|nr:MULTISPECIES: bacteriophage abortive infection AbiH family protein [Pseudomonas syringae group]AVI86657.1 hypothetical protein XJ28_24625 [Pseudomonas syringae pv. tomato]EEB62199.1 hypothetical protein PSPTOT1_0563 [Pseudomonas syringae pv. tomato T1]KGK97373.1 hypothetical protein NB04_01705 [Pseudomonas syringae pv. tomato]KUR41473.1 hypothetical protein PSTA9_03890 [Pseudomonas syringae pv. tomato]KUR44013.1 hypothetical protein PST407_04401 [Pseudomonas syringae pv. tomato]
MDMQTLYVIGNGFDLHHGLPTQYKHFKDFLRTEDSEVYDWVDSYVPAENDWSDLEAALAYLDTDNIVSELEMFLASYSDENWSDSGHHDFQYEVDRVAIGLSRTLQAKFGDWIRSIGIPDRADVKTLLQGLDRSAAFLTFNYTSTLTKLYGVPTDHILFIHGDGAVEASELVLGHAWETKDRVSMQGSLDEEDHDHRIMEAFGTLDEYFESTFKPSKLIIQQNAVFFESLGSIREVVVLGHSLSDVDRAYFVALVEGLTAHPTWTVAVRTADEAPAKTQHLAAFGVPHERVVCRLWSEL